MAYLIHKNGTVRRLADMRYGHNSCGLVVWRGNVCVFGSYYDGGGRKCELLSTQASNWSQLGDMHLSRSLFTPVVWQVKIYLCGGRENRTIETFDGIELRVLAVELLRAGDTLAVVRGDCVLIWTHSTASVLSQDSVQPLLVIKPRSSSSVDTATNPLLYSGLIFALVSGSVCKYSAEDCRSVK